MKKLRLKSLMVGMALCFAGTVAQAGNFENDVNAAIDAGLQYSRTNNHFTAYTAANGLSLLTLLEKKSIPAGYDGLGASDQILAQNAACILIDDVSFGDRGSFYSYYDGQVMMGLSVYLDTGGPDQPAGVAPHNCATPTARSARATIDKVVDRAIAAQTPGTPAYQNCAGYWGYTGTGCDSSTTQFTLAGLASAKGFYSSKGESLDKNRIPLITAALDKTSAGYAANGKQQSTGVFNTCDTQGCYGHGYQAYYGPANNSSQQTASGTWGQLTGAGKTVNDLSIQRYLRWLQNTYNYNTNPIEAGAAYFYYLWSSSKAYNIIEDSGVLPTVGNIAPKDMGTLPASGTTRLVNLDPATVVQPPPRGSNGAGWYFEAKKGWYFDYAYRLMGLQTTGIGSAAGRFQNPNGTWDAEVDHAYAILVLQRSTANACTDNDADGVCDDKDNCPAVYNPSQKDTLGFGVGDACQVRCDYNGDKAITVNPDINAIQAMLNKKAAFKLDPRDADLSGVINVLDARTCSKYIGSPVPIPGLNNAPMPEAKP